MWLSFVCPKRLLIKQQPLGVRIAEVRWRQSDDFFKGFHEIVAVLVAELERDLADILVSVGE